MIEFFVFFHSLNCSIVSGEGQRAIIRFSGDAGFGEMRDCDVATSQTRIARQSRASSFDDDAGGGGLTASMETRRVSSRVTGNAGASSIVRRRHEGVWGAHVRDERSPGVI